MTTLALEHIDEMTEEQLPVELLADPYHPGNATYYESLNAIKEAIVTQSVAMRPIEVEAVRLHLTGLTNTKIAEKLDVHPMSVGKYLKQPESARLKRLFQHLQMALDGPQIELRKHILYRIAVDNEKQRPTVTIQAIQEINKMTGTYEQQAASNTINITINSELLPRGKLDELPPGMIIEGDFDEVPEFDDA